MVGLDLKFGLYSEFLEGAGPSKYYPTREYT